jgi:sirohydrochlorin cobaltochelatase
VAEAAVDLVVASYGAAREQVSIDLCVQAIGRAAEIAVVHTSVISSAIRGRLAARGEGLESPTETLHRLAASGSSRVVVQPLLLLAGGEFHRLVGELASFRTRFASLSVGLPLLGRAADFAKVCDAIQSIAGPPTVFVGHGSEHAAGSAYGCLQAMLDDRQATAYIGSLSGYPDITAVVRRLRRDGAERVALRPLMLVAGRHTMRDIAGDSEESWKGLLERNGIAAQPLIRGLGEERVFQQLFVERALEALDGSQDSFGP